MRLYHPSKSKTAAAAPTVVVPRVPQQPDVYVYNKCSCACFQGIREKYACTYKESSRNSESLLICIHVRRVLARALRLLSQYLFSPRNSLDAGMPTRYTVYMYMRIIRAHFRGSRMLLDEQVSIFLFSGGGESCREGYLLDAKEV